MLKPKGETQHTISIFQDFSKDFSGHYELNEWERGRRSWKTSSVHWYIEGYCCGAAIMTGDKVNLEIYTGCGIKRTY